MMLNKPKKDEVKLEVTLPKHMHEHLLNVFHREGFTDPNDPNFSPVTQALCRVIVRDIMRKRPRQHPLVSMWAIIEKPCPEHADHWHLHPLLVREVFALNHETTVALVLSFDPWTGHGGRESLMPLTELVGESVHMFDFEEDVRDFCRSKLGKNVTWKIEDEGEVEDEHDGIGAPKGNA